VHVPHSKKKAAVDDGPAYVVDSEVLSEETLLRKTSRLPR